MTDYVVPDHYRAWCWEQGTSALGLVLKTVSRPVLQPDEVLVRNHVAGLNPVDWKALGARLAPWEPGWVPGVDGAGVVAAVGQDVGVEWLGRRVAYHQSLMRPGSFAEYTPVRLRAVSGLPPTLDFETAASMPCPALTAWLALTKLPSRADATLLIAGAGGGVGHYLVQLAVGRGFAVTAMCNQRHWARLRAMGVQDCVAGPLKTGEALHDALKNRFHAVIDCVGADHAAALAPALKANGHIVCIQNRLPEWPDPPFTRCISVHEVALGALHQYGDDADWHDLMTVGHRLLTRLAERALVPEETIIRDFRDLPAVLNNLEHRQFFGKALIRVTCVEEE
ncbi:zinc-binding dehydrogenase [Acetobacter sacchari]|uniref:Zinc-binding dehydrogenase n=1 Tax=Acetobacter sacchari TaxID=2661687 RepID=A0ABS3LT24_9PROT|nr:zinc-binding dehydrogenase [Acetobacter sacchari]MBO1359065.1 zinc-binding dehydrogenase [Acetobacter sacchari]